MTKMKIYLFATVFLVICGCAQERFIDEPGNLVPLTVTEDARLPSVKVNGAMLHSEAFGHPDSTLVICVHGGPGSDYRYMLNCRDLADYGYRVVFYDQLGSGLSERFPRRYYTSRGAAALDLFYDELKGIIGHYRTRAGQKVYLLGHSWGGMLATAFSGKYPDLVQGLIVAEPGGLKWSDIMTYVSNSQSFSLWSELLNNVSYKDQFLTAKQDQHVILDYLGAMTTGKNTITQDEDVEQGDFWRLGTVISEAMFEIGTAYEPDLSSDIKQYKQPVLFFYSSQNKAYPLSWAQRISAVYPQVTLYKIDGTGHSGIVSAPHAWRQKTLPAVLAYFNSIN